MSPDRNAERSRKRTRSDERGSTSDDERGPGNWRDLLDPGDGGDPAAAREDADVTEFVDADALARSLGSDPIEPIAIDGVSRRFGGIAAVSDVSLTISPGEFHAFVGPNGSGKTTLGRIVVGLTRPDEGSVAGPTDDVGYGFQRPRCYPDLSVRENVATFRQANRGIDATDEWVDGVQRALGLDRVAGRPAGELSGGFEKKLDLALALLGRPSYLWLDEPLSDLDERSARRVVSLLSAYAEAGGGVVVATHDPEAFSEAMTRASVFVDGVLERTVELPATDAENRS